MFRLLNYEIYSKDWAQIYSNSMTRIICAFSPFKKERIKETKHSNPNLSQSSETGELWTTDRGKLWRYDFNRVNYYLYSFVSFIRFCWNGGQSLIQDTYSETTFLLCIRCRFNGSVRRLHKLIWLRFSIEWTINLFKTLIQDSFIHDTYPGHLLNRFKLPRQTSVH